VAAHLPTLVRLCVTLQEGVDGHAAVGEDEGEVEGPGGVAVAAEADLDGGEGIGHGESLVRVSAWDEVAVWFQLGWMLSMVERYSYRRSPVTALSRGTSKAAH
jgi:hypothetical protein